MIFIKTLTDPFTPKNRLWNFSPDRPNLNNYIEGQLSMIFWQWIDQRTCLINKFPPKSDHVGHYVLNTHKTYCSNIGTNKVWTISWELNVEKPDIQTQWESWELSILYEIILCNIQTWYSGKHVKKNFLWRKYFMSFYHYSLFIASKLQNYIFKNVNPIASWRWFTTVNSID